MNCQIQLDPNYFTCLPNGISPWGQQREVMQLAYEEGIGLLGGLKQQPWGQSKKREAPMAFMSFSVDSNKKERVPLFELGCQNKTSPLHGLVECSYKVFQSQQERLDYYRYVSTFKFIFSPHGVGLDCFRTYEALYLGCYIIVKTSSLDVLYQDLPVLIVQEWSDITKELLDETYEKFQAREFDYTKLYRQYWNTRFRSDFLAPS